VGSLSRASHPAPAGLPLDVPPPVHVPKSGVLLSSDACQSHVRQVFRGPVSTCCQSSGIPASSTAPPPPHLSPWMSVKRPQVAFRKPEGLGPREMSAPVAGQLLWVLRSSRAVGRP